MHKITAIVLLLSPLLVIGQQQHSFSNIERHIGEYSNYKNPHLLKFELDGESNEIKEMPFKITQIIDSTDTKQIYGFVHKGYQNTKRPIKFENGLEHQFQNFIGNYSFYNPLGKEVKMVVNDFWIDSKKDLSKMPGTMILKVNYYADDELILSDLQTKSFKKGSRSYVKFASEMLGRSLDNLSKKLID